MAARIVHFASAAMLAGLMTFLLFVAEPVFRRPAVPSPEGLRRQFIRLGWAALALSVVSGAAWLVLLGARLGGQSLTTGTSRNAVWTVLTETRFGKDWLARLALAALLAVWLTRLGGAGWRSRQDGTIAAVLSACFIGSLAWAGHGGANPGTSGIVQAAGDALHLVAAGAWIGGLVPFALVMAGARQARDRAWSAMAARIVARFSKLGVVVVATLVLTGILNSWFLVGSVPALVGTLYGRLLMLKVGLFIAMVALAAVNRLRLMPRLRDPAQAPDRLLSGLLRNGLIETALGLAILAIVGALGTIPPAAHTQPLWPLPFRFSLDALSDPTRRPGLLVALVASAAGIAAIVAAMLATRSARALRWPALAVGALLVIWSVPRLDLPAVEAHPTSFYVSPTGFSAHAIASGRQLFADNCVSCHGPEGHGDGPAAKDLRPAPADLTAEHIYAHSDGDLFWWITHGIGDVMPPVGAALDDAARWNLIDFIHADADATRLREQDRQTSAGAFRTPTFAVECPDESSPSIGALRGRIVHIVFAGKGSVRLHHLAHSVTRDIATIVVRLEGADAGGPFCSTDDPDVVNAFALYRGAAPRDLDGTELLVDAAGWLRAMWHPGLDPDWSDPQAFAAEIAGIRQAKAARPAVPHVHVHQ